VKCGTPKVLSDFPKYSRREDGLHTSCRLCLNAYARGQTKAQLVKDREAVRAKRLEYQRRYRTRHPEKVAEFNERARPRLEKMRAAGWMANHNLVRDRGLTLSDKKLLMNIAHETCQICGRGLQSVAVACVDHNHESGNIRGVLCHNCNLGLGNFRDSVRALHAAARYLETVPGQEVFV
jgi:hypothetical protein